MDILNGIRRFFFQKASNDFDANEAFRRNQLRYNALRALDPNVLVRHLEAFARGDICGLERVIDEFEMREDKMRIGSFKMAAAVSSKPWKVQIRQGEEENPRAKLHQEHLTKFWNRVEATDAFCRNRKGGLRLLVKQMMSAQSRIYSVHDICWKVNGDGTLNATFTHVPAWCFENRTGRLRYIRNDSDTVGAEMPDGEWLVTVGEGVGVAAAVIAMAKRLSWNDWLLFSEKCGMPVILGNTNAQRDTPAWAAMSRAIRAIAPKTGLLADAGTTLSAVSMGAGGQNTYRALVDTVDRAISALYRGGDLATQSSGPDAAGVNAQAGESELMDDDGCKMVAETLRDQVEKFVIRFELGDFEPLAEIVINPPADTEDVEREMKIDNHLAGLGVKLSKKDALARYGRTEAEDEKDALTPPQTPPQGGFGGLANEKPAQTPLQTAAGAFKNAPSKPDGQGDPSAPPPSQIAKKRPSATEAVLAELASTILDGSVPYEEALKRAQEQLEALDPAILAGGLEKALEEAMFKAAAEAMEESRPSHPSQTSQLANEDEPETLWLFNEDRKKNGQFDVKGSGDKTQGMVESAMERRQRTSREALEKYNASTDHPTAEEVLSGDIAVTDALAKGFEVKFGCQKIIFFTDVLSGHYDNPSRLETDAKRLLLVKRAIAERNKLMPGRHYDSQIVLMSQKHLAPTEKKLVVIADAETGVARSIMMAQQNYCDRHFKLWKK
jgi:phage gp29-like protein